MAKKKKSLEKKCIFDKDGNCHALACYSGEECNARDENGFPKYVISKEQ